MISFHCHCHLLHHENLTFFASMWLSYSSLLLFPLRISSVLLKLGIFVQVLKIPPSLLFEFLSLAVFFCCWVLFCFFVFVDLNPDKFCVFQPPPHFFYFLFFLFLFFIFSLGIYRTGLIRWENKTGLIWSGLASSQKLNGLISYIRAQDHFGGPSASINPKKTSTAAGRRLLTPKMWPSDRTEIIRKFFFPAGPYKAALFFLGGRLWVVLIDSSELFSVIFYSPNFQFSHQVTLSRILLWWWQVAGGGGG